MKAEKSSHSQIISRRETAKRLDIGLSTLCGFISEKSRYYKPDVPKPVRQGSSAGFIEHEIEDYISRLMKARGGDVRR